MCYVVSLCVCVLGVSVAGCDAGRTIDIEDSGEPTAIAPDDPSPLAEFFGWSDTAQLEQDPEATEEQRQVHYQIEQSIVTCMEEAGFEYFPEPFPGDREEPAGDSPLAQMWQLQQEDPEEFARQYGYGISTVDPEYQLIPIGDDVDPSVIEELDDTLGNPNLEYRAGLSEAARREYDIALHGYHWADEEAAIAAGEEIDYESGCRYEAIAATWDEPVGPEQPAPFADLAEAMGELYLRIDNHPRMVEAVSAWAGCMETAGYSGLTSLAEAEHLVRARHAQLYEHSPDPADVDQVALADVREFELAIAWADFGCRQEHEVAQVRREVQFEVEAEFIEDHRDELEAYREWLHSQDR